MSSFSRPFLTLLTDEHPRPQYSPKPSRRRRRRGRSSPTDEDYWRLDALCAETDPEAFFPEKGGSTREARTGLLRVLRCAPSASSRPWRTTSGYEEHLGGLSEREQRRLRVDAAGRAISA